MQGSAFDKPAFRPIPLLLCLLGAALIFGSWAYIDSTRALWDAVDASIFRSLNDSLYGRVWWQNIWAIGNNHFFDFLSSLLMVWLAFRYCMAEDARYLNERVAVVLTIAVIILMAVLTVDKLLIEEKRFSPTAVLDDVFLLTQHVTWLSTKDLSYNSFPSDHATVLLMVGAMLWYFAGRRTGLIMLAAAFIFSFPRLIGGAHWFSDMAAGALPLAMVAVALGIFTPLHRYIIRGWLWVLNKPFFHAGIRTGMHSEAPALLAKGCCMGAADVVPGVSGGTMAYILGIWPRLIEAIKSFDIDWIKQLLRGEWTRAVSTPHIAFLVPVFVGIVVAFITFTRFIPLPSLILTHPEPIYGLFFGLIGGSVLLLLMETGRLSARDIAIIGIGVVLGWLLVNGVPVQTPETWWFVYLCGCIAISAMLLPGISGSFILLILGKYAYILGALGEFNFAVILPFVLGCATGVVVFSRAASWLLHHHYRPTVLTITGILVGSLWMIWPFQERIYETVREKARLVASSPVWPETLTQQGWLAVALMVAGFAAVMALGYVAKRRPPAPNAALQEPSN